MPVITPAGRPQPAITPKFGIAATVSANDPVQKVTNRGNGAFRISGTANNRGFVPSFLSVKFDKTTLTVMLSGGMKPADTAEALRKQLPAGYKLVTVKDGDALVFGIVGSAKNDPQAVEKGFERAQGPKTPGKTLLTKRELQTIVKEARKDGFTAEEKDAVARRWAGTFNGAGYQATPAAQREYARIAAKYGLPVYYVR